jgi:hypothetical protein
MHARTFIPHRPPRRRSSPQAKFPFAPVEAALRLPRSGTSPLSKFPFAYAEGALRPSESGTLRIEKRHFLTRKVPLFCMQSAAFLIKRMVLWLFKKETWHIK